MSRPLYFSGPPVADEISSTISFSRLATALSSSLYLPSRERLTLGSFAAAATESWTIAATAALPPRRSHSAFVAAAGAGAGTFGGTGAGTFGGTGAGPGTLGPAGAGIGAALGLSVLRISSMAM